MSSMMNDGIDWEFIEFVQDYALKHARNFKHHDVPSGAVEAWLRTREQEGAECKYEWLHYEVTDRLMMTRIYQDRGWHELAQKAWDECLLLARPSMFAQEET